MACIAGPVRNFRRILIVIFALARPSSRSSQRSSGSISSYGHRRTSGVPLHGSKGVLVSASRTGAARSAAILLVSCHISAMNSPQNTNPLCGTKYNENMREYLKQQLEQQKQLLFLDIPALKSRKNFLSKLNKYAAGHSSSHHNASASSNNASHDSMLNDDNENAPPYHIYANHNYCNNTSRDTSSCDGLEERDLDDDVVDDWDDDLSVERFELAALPTPASEQAHVVVKKQKTIEDFFFLIIFRHTKIQKHTYTHTHKHSHIVPSVILALEIKRTQDTLLN